MKQILANETEFQPNQLIIKLKQVLGKIAQEKAGFENPEYYPFHMGENPFRHTEDVMARAAKSVKAFVSVGVLSPKQANSIILAAAFHDVIQKHSERGLNELQSSDLAIKFIKDNKLESNLDTDLVEAFILSTLPSFKSAEIKPEAKTTEEKTKIYNGSKIYIEAKEIKNLSSEKYSKLQKLIIELIVFLSDLGGASLVGNRRFNVLRLNSLSAAKIPEYSKNVEVYQKIIKTDAILYSNQLFLEMLIKQANLANENAIAKLNTIKGREVSQPQVQELINSFIKYREGEVVFQHYILEKFNNKITQILEFLENTNTTTDIEIRALFEKLQSQVYKNGVQDAIEVYHNLVNDEAKVLELLKQVYEKSIPTKTM